ncbi:MAG: hypothetical protein JSV20_03175, partial [Candidatus Bathyarchaeota archaeon]
GEGFRHQELYVCVDCWTLLMAIIEDSLPMTLHEVSKKVEATSEDKPLLPYHYEEKGNSAGN